MCGGEGGLGGGKGGGGVGKGGNTPFFMHFKLFH